MQNKLFSLFLLSFKTANYSGIRKHKFEKEVYLFKYLKELENNNNEKSKNIYEEHEKNIQKEYLNVELNDITISFIILAFGSGISLIVFIIELKIYIQQHRKKI